MWMFLYLVLSGLILIGWVINLASVVQLSLAAGTITTLFIMKIIGIFIFPLGAFLGWFA